MNVQLNNNLDQKTKIVIDALIQNGASGHFISAVTKLDESIIIDYYNKEWKKKNKSTPETDAAINRMYSNESEKLAEDICLVKSR